MKKITILLTLFGLVQFLNGSELIDQAAIIANQEYSLHRLTLVVWWRDNAEDNNDVTHFLKQFKGLVETFNVENVNFMDIQREKYHQTVIFADEPDDFKYFLQRINPTVTLSLRVIMILTNDKLDSADVFTKIAWNNDISDILILRIDTNGKIKYSTYKPYGNGGCANHTAIDLNINTRFNKTFFIRKYNNFYKCPVRVNVLNMWPYVKFIKDNNTVTDIDGVDSKLLKLILERLNCSLDIILYRYHGSKTNKSDFMDDLVNNVADILIPGLVWTAKRHAIVQVSYAYNTIHVVWCAPGRREILEWAKIILPFLNMSTVLIITGFFIMSVTIKLINRIIKVKDKSDKNVIFIMLGLFLGQDMNFNSRYWLINGLYNFWIWFCLIVRISYQGNLVDGLQKSILEPKLTLEETLQVVDGVGGSGAFLEYYRNTTIENKFIILGLRNTSSYIKDIGAGKNFMLAADLLQVKYYDQTVQVLDELALTMPTSFHMRPRWPASYEISRLGAQIVESGIYMKISNDIIGMSLLRNEKLQNTDNAFEPMGMDILKSCFYGLIFMYIISFAVLLAEIIGSKYKKKK